MHTDRRRFLTGSLALATLRAELAPELEVQGALVDAYDLDPALLYLNHASIGTVPRVVREAHGRYLELCESNPWRYVWGEEWAGLLDEVHGRAARWLGCGADDVALTANTTCAFGLLASGLEVVQGARDEVLFPSWNHVGASQSWRSAAEARGYRVRSFEFPEGEVPGLSPEDVVALYREAISERTSVLVLPHVDNVLGLRHPVREIAAAARELGVSWICVDAAQTVGMIPFEVEELGVDLLATSAHKWLQAPKGTGLAYVAPRMRPHLRPLVSTWGAERWEGTARAYTDFGARALPSLLAMDDALRFQEGIEGREEHHRELFDHARERAEDHPRLSWRSPREFAQGAALFAIGVEGIAAPELWGQLYEEHGVVLRPFGGGGRNHLRVSPNMANTTGDLDRLFEWIDGAIG